MFKRIISVLCALSLFSVSALCFAEGNYGGNTTEGDGSLNEIVDYLSLKDTSSLYFEGDFVCGVTAGTTVVALKNQFENSDNITISSTTVKTGATVTYKGAVDDVATIVVDGDVNGDGKVTVTDITAAWNIISGSGKASDAAFKAADIDNTGKLNVVDVACIRKLALG